MSTPSLLDWAAAPSSSPSPLPPLVALRRGSWPVGLLPMREIAQDLSRRGLCYQRGSGFTILDEPVDDHEVARLTSVTLQIAAETLHSTKSRSDLFVAHEALLEAESDRLQTEAHAATDNYETAEEIFQATSSGARALARGIRSALDAPNALALDRSGYSDDWSDHRSALASTARDVRASSGARTALLKSLRAALPASTDAGNPFPAPSLEDVLEPFLASLDTAEELRRSALVRLYNEARRPGDLRDADLRAVAAARWGAPRPQRGIFIYRPARAARAA